MIQHRETDFLKGAVVDRRSSSVINDPIAGAFARLSRVSHKDHDVVRVFLNPGLEKEEQVAGLSVSPVAANEGCVKCLECSRVSEIGKTSVVDVGALEYSIVRAKKFFFQHAVFEIIRAHVLCYGLVSGPHPAKPFVVMAPQSLAPRKPDQARAIPLLFVPRFAHFVKLHFGDSCEPLLEMISVSRRKEFGSIGNAVAIGIVELRVDARLLFCGDASFGYAIATRN